MTKKYIDWDKTQEELRAHGLLAEPDKGIKVGGVWLWPLKPGQTRRDRTWIGASR